MANTEIVELVKQWFALEDRINADETDEELADELSARQTDLEMKISEADADDAFGVYLKTLPVMSYLSDDYQSAHILASIANDTRQIVEKTYQAASDPNTTVHELVKRGDNRLAHMESYQQMCNENGLTPYDH